MYGLETLDTSAKILESYTDLETWINNVYAEFGI